MKYIAYYQAVGDYGEWRARPGSENRVISSPDAAKEMRIKAQTLRKWRMNEAGPLATPIGKRQGYRVKDLVRFMNQLRTDIKELERRGDTLSKMRAEELKSGDSMILNMFGYKEIQRLK